MARELFVHGVTVKLTFHLLDINCLHFTLSIYLTFCLKISPQEVRYFWVANVRTKNVFCEVTV